MQTFISLNEYDKAHGVTDGELSELMSPFTDHDYLEDIQDVVWNLHGKDFRVCVYELSQGYLLLTRTGGGSAIVTMNARPSNELLNNLVDWFASNLERKI